MKVSAPLDILFHFSQNEIAIGTAPPIFPCIAAGPDRSLTSLKIQYLKIIAFWNGIPQPARLVKTINGCSAPLFLPREEDLPEPAEHAASHIAIGDTASRQRSLRLHRRLRGPDLGMQAFLSKLAR